MPPPIVNVGANPILAGNAIPVPQAGNVDNPNNVPEVDNNNPVNAPTNALLPELEGPNLQPGNGQARNFAANHVVEYGKNWDLESAGGMLKTAQKAVEKIKSVISGDKAFDAYVLSMERTVVDVCKQAVDSGHAVSDADRIELKNLLDEIRALADEIVLVRSTLTDAVKDGSGVADPRAAIAQIRKTLRVFRYEMQVQLGKKGHYAGRMEANEGNLRALQNTFTFFVGSKIGTTFPRVWEREDELFGQLAQKDRELRAKLQSIFLRVELPEPPKDMRLFDVVGEALDLSHNTNNQIRQFQDRDASAATLRHIVGPIAEKGGFRKVEFTAGVGALIGLGFSTAFTAGLRAGARFRVVGEIKCLWAEPRPSSGRRRATSGPGTTPSSKPLRASNWGISRRGATRRSTTSSGMRTIASSQRRGRSEVRFSAESCPLESPSTAWADHSSAGWAEGQTR